MMQVLYEHITTYPYLPLEQWAICIGHHGCLNILIIYSIIAKEVMVCRCDLSVAWIDYQKVYDRVPTSE